METLQNYLPIIKEYVLLYGFKIVTALAIFIIGKFVVKLLSKAVGKAITKSGADPMLAKFLTNIAYALMLTFVVIASISQLGVQTASLVAILGAAGLAVGLALQGSLSNFAAGVMAIVFRPYNAGDVVELAGLTGKVEEVDIFTTTLRLPDKTKIIIPNAQALDGPIKNFSEAGTRRCELAVGISYDADIGKARDIILKTVTSSEMVLKDPEPTVGVIELADNSVNLVVRPWVNSGDYAVASMALLEAIKVALDDAGIGIPYPQRDVHVYNH